MQKSVDTTVREKWLVFSYFSNIDGMACAQHLDDRLPWFKEFGVTPVLVSGVCGEGRPNLLHFRVPSIAPSGIRFESRHWLRRRVGGHCSRKSLGLLVASCCLPFYLLEKLAVDLDSQWSWFVLAAHYGQRLCRKHHPTLIYSTGGAASAHLAAALVSHGAKVPWMAEFQDPLVYPGLPRSRRSTNLYAWVERLVARRASRVVFLTETARDRFGQRTGTANNLCVIYPGADPDKFSLQPRQQGDVCRFAHFGTLAGSRNLRSFLQALDKVFELFPVRRHEVQIHLYGHMDGPMRDLVGRFPHAGIIHDHGRRPRQEVWSDMAQSDVLLLVQNQESISTETIPSKLYEYFLSSRPVFALINQNKELKTMLEERGHLVAEVSDVLAIQQGITKIMELWRKELVDSQSAPASPMTIQLAVERLVETGRQTTSSLQVATSPGS